MTSKTLTHLLELANETLKELSDNDNHVPYLETYISKIQKGELNISNDYLAMLMLGHEMGMMDGMRMNVFETIMTTRELLRYKEYLENQENGTE